LLNERYLNYIRMGEYGDEALDNNEEEDDGYEDSSFDDKNGSVEMPVAERKSKQPTIYCS
jgi:hypothetical protein